MSSTISNLPQPLKLTENAIQEWHLFKQRWDAYTILSNYNSLELNKKKAILITCLGDDALQIYYSFTIDETTTIVQIFTMFENYIVGSTNDTYERFKFNKRSQSENESFDCFVADLK